MNPQSIRPPAQGPLRPFLRWVLRDAPVEPVFRGPSFALRVGPRERERIHEIARSGRLGCFRRVETSPLDERVFALTDLGHRWVDQGATLEEGYG